MPESDFIVMTVEDHFDDDDEMNDNADDYDGEKVGWVSDRYIDNKHAKPKMDVSQDVIIIQADQLDGYSYMTIARKTDTRDPQDYDIEDSKYLLWALGNTDQFNIHRKTGWTHIDWRDGDASTTNSLPLIWIHGMLMIFAWMYLGFISSALARYCKALQGAAWIIVHIFLSLLSIFFMLCAFGIIIADVSVSDHKTHFDSYHKIAGLIIIAATLIQPVLIALFKVPVLGDKIKEASAVVWMIAMAQHRIFGQLLFLFGLVNIGTGLILYQTHVGLWVCFGVWVGLIVLYWFVHEIFSVTTGFNEFVGRVGEAAPANIFANVYAFIVAVTQGLFLGIITIIFIIMVVLFAVYEEGYAKPYHYSGN